MQRASGRTGTAFIGAVMAAGLLAACGPPQPAADAEMAADESSAASEGLLFMEGTAALVAQEPAEAPALTLTRTVHEGAEGQDAHVMVRLEAGPERFVELHEANHTPFDVTAQAAGGVLAAAIGAGAATPVFYQIADTAGAPLICGTTAPASMALYEDGAGDLVVVGLTIASFAGTESESGITIAPMPADAVCGRAVYRRG